MSLNDTQKVVQDLRDKVQTKQDAEDKVVLRSGDGKWEMSSDAALRIAAGLEEEITKVLARE